MRPAKEESPPFNKPREATPDLTTFTNIQKRERRMTQWDIKPASYENITAGWHRNSLQSHWSAYYVQWLTLEAPPPRVSASAFPDDAPWDDRQQLCPGQEHITIAKELPKRRLREHIQSRVYARSIFATAAVLLLHSLFH